MTLSAAPANPISVEPFRQVLTSAARNFDVGDWSIRSDAVLGESGRFSVSKRRLQGGRQAGVDIILIEAGQLAISVSPTRGMGIVRVDSPALSLGWQSPIQEVRHPQFVNLESRGGLGWLEGFSEWLVRCGLEFAGGPGKDRFVTNTGATAEMDLTLHGKIANIPASEVELIVDRTPPFTLRLRGRVDETMFYGPKLELWTELRLTPGTDEFQVIDTVLNRGGTDQEFELIYHINYGPPLLEAGSQFVAPVARVMPMNDHAAASLQDYPRYAGPTPGFVEQVYCLQPAPGPGGKTLVMLRNAAGTRGSSIRYSTEELPCFTLWKNTSPIVDGYVTGLEPGTNYPNNRRLERKAGRLSRLKPGQSRRFCLEFGLHTSADEVRAVAEEIKSMQGTTHIQMVSKPEQIE